MMSVDESVTTTGMRRDIKKNIKNKENVTANTYTAAGTLFSTIILKMGNSIIDLKINGLIYQRLRDIDPKAARI
jgi:hypothetical protein